MSKEEKKRYKVMNDVVYILLKDSYDMINQQGLLYFQNITDVDDLVTQKFKCTAMAWHKIINEETKKLTTEMMAKFSSL